MPGITIERPRMTRAMYQALKRHIMRERERKKQEQEHDKAMEQRRMEQEQRKKKEEEDSLTMEQTKDQIANMEKKLETLKGEKHELFSQLKKVLHQEDENRKRAQIKEHNEMLNLQQYNVSVPAHPMFMQAHMQQRAKNFMTVSLPQPMVTGVKRPHSPSPPPSSGMYPNYPGGKFPTTTSLPFSSPQIKREEGYPTVAKAASYPSTHVTFASQSGHPYTQPHIQHQNQPTQHQAPPTQHQAPPTQHQAPPTQHQAPSTQHQAPPSQHQAQSGQPLPSQHQAQSQPHQATPTQHQTPPTQHQAPPSQHRASVPQHQTTPSQHPVPPPQHSSTPTQHQDQSSQHHGSNPQQAPPPHSQAPPIRQPAAPTQHQAPPRHPQVPPTQQGGAPTQHPASQSQSGKYPAGQPAFQTYQTHYAHQQKGSMPDIVPQSYPVPRIAQPGYIGSPHTGASLSLQQQLEHANQKSGFSADKIQQPMRGGAGVGTPPQPSQILSAAHPQTSQPSPQAQPKGSIVTGHPVRTQASSSNYSPASTQSSHSPHAPGPRHAYFGSQSSGRYH